MTRAGGWFARRVRPFLAPQWILGHVVVLALSVTMVLLGRWQLDVSDRKGFDWQNFGYALQWWAFTAGALLFWARVMRDKYRPPSTELALAPGGRVLARRPSGATAPVTAAGPAYLVAPGSGEGGEAAVYRGYVMPSMADRQTHSEDEQDAAYNDYLWQLALKDQAEGHGEPSGGRFGQQS